MSSNPERSRRYRVSAFRWSAGDDAHLELAEVHHTAAPSAREAIAATELRELAEDADRVVLDAQRLGVRPRDKGGQWAPWRVVVIWIRGHGEYADVVREGLRDLVTTSAVIVDDAGNLGVAAALAGTLDGEAESDLEEQLELIFEANDLDLYDALSSSVETSVRADEPLLPELRSELNSSTTHSLTEACPLPAQPQLIEVEPEGPEDRALYCEMLLTFSQGQVPHPEALAEQFDTGLAQISLAFDTLERWGLASRATDGLPPMLFDAGAQFLARHGRVPIETLEFLPGPIDDLNAREALRRASFILMGEFTQAIAEGNAVEYARERIVPQAFSSTVDLRLATRLYAAASALCVRLSDGRPAGCVAEEVVAVALMQEAEDLPELRDGLPEEDARRAAGELRGLFELFQDDDVLSLFEMADPGDAAVAGHDPINRQMGVVDQRVEAWFEPFGWTTPSGHLEHDPYYRWP
jgi:hypothetical protein